MSESVRRGSVSSALLTLLIPGLGQAVFGHGRRGALWLLGAFAAWAIPSLLAAFWLGSLGVGLALLLAVWLAAAVDAWRAPRQPLVVRGLIELLVVLVLITSFGQTAVALVIRTTALEAFKVPSGGMCPTLEVGDHVFVDKTAYRGGRAVKVGDVVVHRARDASGREAAFIRRVIAVAGDEVFVDDQARVTLNGRTAAQRALGRSVCDPTGGMSAFEEQLEGESGSHLLAIEANVPAPASPPTRVPPGELYLVGDNRMNSHDSRITGTIEADTVIGRAWRIWLRGPALTWQPVR